MVVSLLELHVAIQYLLFMFCLIARPLNSGLWTLDSGLYGMDQICRI